MSSAMDGSVKFSKYVPALTAVTVAKVVLPRASRSISCLSVLLRASPAHDQY